jgi:hypothetical protein
MYPAAHRVRSALPQQSVQGDLSGRLTFLSWWSGDLQYGRRSLPHIRLLVPVANVDEFFSLLLSQSHFQRLGHWLGQRF